MPQNPFEMMNSMFMQMNTNLKGLMDQQMQMAEAVAPHNVLPKLLKGGEEVVKKAAKDIEDTQQKVFKYKSRSFEPYPQGTYYQYNNKVPIF